MTPRELAEERIQLAGEYQKFSGDLEIILLKKPRAWLDLRATTNSDAAADKLWQASDDGLQETIIRIRLKAIEKKLSSLRTMLEVLQGEARNVM